jgi:hypothetical protein
MLFYNTLKNSHIIRKLSFKIAFLDFPTKRISLFGGYFTIFLVFLTFYKSAKIQSIAMRQITPVIALTA